MLDRESTFADPQILNMLKEKFVPVALDQWYTRRQQDSEGDFYRQIAGQGPRNDFKSTTQGLYIADASGKLIAYNNNRGPERIRKLMQSAVDNFTAPKTPVIESRTVDKKYEARLPEGGAIVRVAARVEGGYKATDDPWQKIFHAATSRDNLWITADEQAALAKGTFPEILAKRIARFHLVDNTRGQPPTWTLGDVRELEMKLKDGQITGTFRLETDNHDRGFVGKISGICETKDQKLTRINLLAEGEFWGTGQYTLEPPEGKFPLVVAFRLADGSDIGDPIPPHASRGWLDGYLDPNR